MLPSGVYRGHEHGPEGVISAGGGRGGSVVKLRSLALETTPCRSSARQRSALSVRLPTADARTPDGTAALGRGSLPRAPVQQGSLHTYGLSSISLTSPAPDCELREFALFTRHPSHLCLWHIVSPSYTVVDGRPDCCIRWLSFKSTYYF